MIQLSTSLRKKMRDREKSLALFDIILQNIDNGIAVYDKNGAIVYENEIAEKYRKIFIRKTVKILDDTGNLITVADLPVNCAVRDKLVHTKRIEIVTHSNKPNLWFRIRSVPIFDKRNRMEYILDTWTDISNTILEGKRRDHFIAIGSHELRTPLAGIKVLNQVIYKFYREKKFNKARSFFGKIDEKVNILTEIIHDFIEVEKIRGGKLVFNPEEFDFDSMVTQTVQDLAMTYKSHKLRISGSTHIPIIADKVRIEEVLNNLIGNARKYSPKSSVIDIRLVSGDKTVTVVVQDYGFGIAKKYLFKIFQPLYRVRDSTVDRVSGLGLGLYISYKIVELHGGKMWVKSKLGQGSSFYFSLPRVIKKTKKVYDF